MHGNMICSRLFDRLHYTRLQDSVHFHSDWSLWRAFSSSPSKLPVDHCFIEHTVQADAAAKLAFHLRQCASLKAISQGRCLHAHIMKIGHEQNGFLANLLLQMYGKCGSVKDARALLATMQRRDVFSWTFMIGAYALVGQSQDALHVFYQMQLDGVMPNKFTFIYMLSACTDKEALVQIKQLHTYVSGSEFEKDAIVGTALVCTYSTCGSLNDAWTVFKNIREKDVVSWNAIISACAKHGADKEALRFFHQMLLEGLLPSKVTLLNALDACVSQLALAKGKRIHTHIVASGFQSDVVLGNALVSLYGKCGSLQEAYVIFDKMHDRSVVSWTAMIAALAHYGQSKEVMRLLQLMEKEGVMPDEVTFTSSLSACASPASFLEGQFIYSCILNKGLESEVVVGTALVSMYGKCGSLENAWRVFDTLPKRDVICWNAMIAAYAQYGHGKQALQLFGQMDVEQLMPSKVTFTSILDACANTADLAEGKRLHVCILHSGCDSEIIVVNALLNMYGRCGSLEASQYLFDKMPDRNVVSWTAIIAAYGQQGHGKEALGFLERMEVEGVMPNEVTFVSVLAACSHAGLVDEGWHCFMSMKQYLWIVPTAEHYDCMVDLFGRAGLLDQGEALINSMPFQPTPTTWMAFLGACKTHFDAERAINAALHVLELDPDNAAPYVLLSNVHTASGRGIDAKNLNEVMTDNQGYSFIEVTNRIHGILQRSELHELNKEMQAELEMLKRQLEEEEWVAKTQWVLYDADEDEQDYSPSAIVAS